MIKNLRCSALFIWNIEKDGLRDGLRNIYFLLQKEAIMDMYINLKILLKKLLDLNKKSGNPKITARGKVLPHD